MIYLGKKYSVLQWNQEMFYSLKESFSFVNQEKKSKPLKRPLFLKTQEKCSNGRLFTLFINIHKFIIQND